MAEYQSIIDLLTGKPDFKDYQQKAEKYISRPHFKGTQMTGEMLRNAAEKTFNEQNMLIPIELSLAQAQKESSMGTKGRSPVNNPFNVGEFDEGTKLEFDSPQKGINAYYDLIARRYLNSKTIEQLLSNFTNDEGNRYAKDPGYETYLQNQMPFIKKYFK